MVGLGGVPRLCDFNNFACPTGLKARTGRKREFPNLSNLLNVYSDEGQRRSVGKLKSEHPAIDVAPKHQRGREST